jgi:predicted phosphodiesterase
VIAARAICLVALLFAADSAADQTIALISDLNGRYGSTGYHERVDQAIDAVIALQPDLVLSAGDMVAGQKQPKLDQQWLDAMWREFSTTVTSRLGSAQIPLLVTAGNHDGSGYPAFALERERYAAHWSAHEPGIEILPGSEWPWRYAARLGGVLLITFDGTRPGLLPETEKRFIAAMLTAHAPDARATIVFAHLPMWPLARGREKEIIADPDLLELLHGGGVDVYASGHHHLFFPGIDSGGMLHLGVGALGGNARAFSGGRERQPHGFALLTFADQGLRVSARIAPDYRRAPQTASLPALIDGPLGALHRLDGPAALRP